jgi:hypothetical protein
MELKDFLRFLEENHIPVKRNWSNEGAWDNISIFGIGRCYVGEYQRIKFIASRITSEATPIGFKIKFFYPTPINLGLCLKAGGGEFLPLLHYEHPALFSKK